MNSRNLAGRITALEAKKNSGIEVWITDDDEHLVHQHDGRKLRRSELPDDGKLHIVIREFTPEWFEQLPDEEVL